VSFSIPNRVLFTFPSRYCFVHYRCLLCHSACMRSPVRWTQSEGLKIQPTARPYGPSPKGPGGFRRRLTGSLAVRRTEALEGEAALGL